MECAPSLFFFYESKAPSFRSVFAFFGTGPMSTERGQTLCPSMRSIRGAQGRGSSAQTEGRNRVKSRTAKKERKKTIVRQLLLRRKSLSPRRAAPTAPLPLACFLMAPPESCPSSAAAGRQQAAPIVLRKKEKKRERLNERPRAFARCLSSFVLSLYSL